MRKILLPLLLLFASCATIATQEQMKHEYIIELPNTSKDVIYDKTYRYIAQNFRSAKDVIDMQDKANGTLIAKGIIPQVDYGAMGGPGDLHFTLTMDIRDNKARLNYTNIDMVAIVGSDEIHITNTTGVHSAADREFQKMNAEIVKAISLQDKF